MHRWDFEVKSNITVGLIFKLEVFHNVNGPENFCSVASFDVRLPIKQF